MLFVLCLLFCDACICCLCFGVVCVFSKWPSCLPVARCNDHKQQTPWTDTSSTMVGIAKNGVTFAAISLDGNVDYVNKPSIEPFECTLQNAGAQEYHVDIQYI